MNPTPEVPAPSMEVVASERGNRRKVNSGHMGCWAELFNIILSQKPYTNPHVLKKKTHRGIFLIISTLLVLEMSQRSSELSGSQYWVTTE